MTSKRWRPRCAPSSIMGHDEEAVAFEGRVGSQRAGSSDRKAPNARLRKDLAGLMLVDIDL